MKKDTINKFTSRVQEILDFSITVEDYCKSHNIPVSWFATTYERMYEHYYQKHTVTSKDFDLATRLWQKAGSRNLLDSTTYREYDIDFEEQDTFEDKVERAHQHYLESNCSEKGNEIIYERDDNNRITSYKFTIYRTDKSPLTGKFSRDEMNTIYRLYSYYGLSLTQKDVSRQFPEYSLIDFKRILRAFNITKSCSPFAPHMLEEHTEEELISMTLRAKEDKFLVKIESEQTKNTEKMLVQYAQENAELKTRYNNRNDILKSLEFTSIEPFRYSDEITGDTLIIYLSDMHIGARVDQTSIFSNYYDQGEVFKRLTHVLQSAVGNRHYKEIIVCNLGDSLDGMDMQTSRRDHLLPQNMNNKEQVQTFIKVMTWFMRSLASQTQSLVYTCVGEANHDGDFGWLANVALGAYLEQVGVHVTISDTFIHHIQVEDTYLVCAHGKDTKDMKKNMPLTVDMKTELFIQDYLDYNHLNGKIVVVKGDLHQSATSYAKRFKYKSVSSLFGASEWVHKNFGNTQWGCDFTIIRNGIWMDGLVTSNNV